ncbi:hypothetical protein C8Q76DRAFT_693737 [Earliella scabrosa]|nr:hypothetical protein C8Q76DRAFT_693737 [Earliella scabrosa]
MESIVPPRSESVPPSAESPRPVTSERPEVTLIRQSPGGLPTPAEGSIPGAHGDDNPWSPRNTLRANQILEGPRFANGGRPDTLPITRRLMPEFDRARVDVVFDYKDDDPEDVIDSFIQHWFAVTQRHRDADDYWTAAEEEQWHLLMLLTDSVPALAAATASRRRVTQQNVISAMRMLVEGLDALRVVEEEVRQEVAGDSR